MQDTTWTPRWTNRLVRQRRWLARFGLPILTLAALLAGFPTPVLIALVGAQILMLGWAAERRQSVPLPAKSGALPVFQTRAVIEDAFETIPGGAQSAALAIHLDEADRLLKNHGQRYFMALHDALRQRLAQTLREQDSYCLLDDSGFGVALYPQRKIDLGSVLGVSQRIQTRLAQPFTFEDVTHWPTVSIGFCLSARAAALNSLGMLQAAEVASKKAQASGPGGLHSYSVVDFPASVTEECIAELAAALENGEIRAFFQPQVHTSTGEISGLEALARWNHPQRGLIPPSDFIPQIEVAGLSPKLAARMFRDSMETMAALEADGQRVPSVSVNVSAGDLRNPRLADEIAWDLDRYDLSPDRLTIEILETVVADGDDDVAIRTIARLAGMGCGIDLDDFGTGHASIANIRRFAVGRIKIDRSFVTNMHENRDQQRMVAAILSMSDQLELQTVAEGVECAEEQIMLAQMGCQHLQGFAIARPMPAEHLGDWLRAHEIALQCGEPWCEDPVQARAASGAGS